MPAVDPFSAASKPLLPVDSLPSQPLQFAATLHHEEHLTGSSAVTNKLPRPRRQKEPTPANFPTPQYSHSRHTSEVSNVFSDLTLGSPGSRRGQIGDDDWMQAQVARCVDAAKADLDIADLPKVERSHESRPPRRLLPSSAHYKLAQTELPAVLRASLAPHHRPPQPRRAKKERTSPPLRELSWPAHLSPYDRSHGARQERS
ncbi:hypothetical protein CI109_106174 [Kwoniella shandongensis]|uniref:Uncharacterized protein n=1 Tax=Kwoniella shandongensis TaxID=1734106 RepID=A0AAJ8LLR7_9TREE